MDNKKEKWHDYQIRFVDWARNTSKENRIGLMKMLLSNLTVDKIRDVQNICSRIIKRKQYSDAPTPTHLCSNEDSWCDLPDAERLTNWAGYTSQVVLVGFIKLLLPYYRKNEIQEIRSSWTFHARKELHYDGESTRLT